MALVDLLRDDLQVTDEAQARLAKWGQLVLPEVKVAMALRFLAGGSALDLKLIYRVSKSYVYDCVWLVVDAINNRLPVEFPIDDKTKLRKMEQEWCNLPAGRRCPGWRGQVGALDGVHFPMIAPTLKDVANPMQYFVARKDKYALLCVAICDAKRRITWYDISQASQTHDSTAFGITKLGVRVQQESALPEGFFINADSAFCMSNSVITPTGGKHDDFDFQQSSMRVPIECAFGELVRRWPILWKPLQVAFRRRASLIGACIRLHNYCIDARIKDETLVLHGLAHVQPNSWEQIPRMHEYFTEGRRQGRKSRQRQTAHLRKCNFLISAVEESGVTRPALAPGLVKKKRRRAQM